MPLIGGSSHATAPSTSPSTRPRPRHHRPDRRLQWLLDLWAALWLGAASGNIGGFINGTSVAGSTSGNEPVGTFIWSDNWTGGNNPTDFAGEFEQHGALQIDEYTGTFSAFWIGP
ncbi:MAG: hypothetical protein R3F59_17600 [Myxococcota bacterium]